jgi:hypothetical protein
MKYTISIAIVLFCAVAVPASQARPVLVDQFGGTTCYEDCETLGHLRGEYYFLDIPQKPDVVRGYTEDGLAAQLITPVDTLQHPTSLAGVHDLIQNPALDVAYCMDAHVFAQGWYDTQSQVRVAPVCQGFNGNVLREGYATLPTTYAGKVTHAHYFSRDYADRAYFSNYIPLEEIQGMFVQGITDSALYVVNGESLKYIGQSKKMNMDDHTILMSDAVVYSYPIKGRN